MNLCYLFSDLLNVNGSRGNPDCLLRRLEWRGIDANLIYAPLGWDGDFSAFQLVYLGAGHGEGSEALSRETRRLSGGLCAYAENGGAILAVCDGFELLGKSVRYGDGTLAPGFGVLDMTVDYLPARLTGNYVFDCGGDIGPVAAFRNHAGRVDYGPGLAPLGTLPDGSAEGARYKNVFGSYGHGSLLPKNPALADAVLAAALGQALPPLDDTLEHNARAGLLGKQA